MASEPVPEGRDLALLLVYAFRYALGRRSSAPSDVAGMVLRYRHALEPWEVAQICEDATRAIHTNTAGDPCDVRTWQALIDALGKDR